MARIAATTHVEAEPSRVWRVLVDWEAQPRWMTDARRVEVRSEQREGVGVGIRCRTALGPLVVTDNLVTTQWDEPSVLAIRHDGPVIHGIGAFELTPTPYGTAVEWWEEVEPPLGAAGEVLVGALVAPLIARTFRRSLANLKRLCERDSVRP